MAIQGDIYITVDAQSVNGGISTMAVSGSEPIIGDTEIQISIVWQYDSNSTANGIAGKGWFIGTPYSPITGYESDADFEAALALEADPGPIIRGFIDSWTATQKVAFWDAQASNVWGCVDWIANGTTN